MTAHHQQRNNHFDDMNLESMTQYNKDYDNGFYNDNGDQYNNQYNQQQQNQQQNQHQQHQHQQHQQQQQVPNNEFDLTSNFEEQTFYSNMQPQENMFSQYDYGNNNGNSGPAANGHHDDFYNNTGALNTSNDQVNYSQMGSPTPVNEFDELELNQPGYDFSGHNGHHRQQQQQNQNYYPNNIQNQQQHPLGNAGLAFDNEDDYDLIANNNSAQKISSNYNSIGGSNTLHQVDEIYVPTGNQVPQPNPLFERNNSNSLESGRNRSGNAHKSSRKNKLDQDHQDLDMDMESVSRMKSKKNSSTHLLRNNKNMNAQMLPGGCNAQQQHCKHATQMKKNLRKMIGPVDSSMAVFIFLGLILLYLMISNLFIGKAVPDVVEKDDEKMQLPSLSNTLQGVDEYLHVTDGVNYALEAAHLKEPEVVEPEGWLSYINPFKGKEPEKKVEPGMFDNIGKKAEDVLVQVAQNKEQLENGVKKVVAVVKGGIDEVAANMDAKMLMAATGGTSGVATEMLDRVLKKRGFKTNAANREALIKALMEKDITALTKAGLGMLPDVADDLLPENMAKEFDAVAKATKEGDILEVGKHAAVLVDQGADKAKELGIDALDKKFNPAHDKEKKENIQKKIDELQALFGDSGQEMVKAVIEKAQEELE